MVRRSDSGFDVNVAPRIRAGSRLPTSGIESYVLVLRLYDFAGRRCDPRGALGFRCLRVTVRSCPYYNRQDKSRTVVRLLLWLLAGGLLGGIVHLVAVLILPRTATAGRLFAARSALPPSIQWRPCCSRWRGLGETMPFMDRPSPPRCAATTSATARSSSPCRG